MEQSEFRDSVREFLQRALTPDLRRAGELMTSVFADFDATMRWHRILHAQGWVAPDWPEEYGGTGWDINQRHIFQEECKLANAPALLPMGLQMLGPMLIHYGTPEQRAHYLPRILSGEDVWCQGYSEPGAGSDLASLKTSATRDGDHYLINGSKMFVTNGRHGTMFALAAKTDPQADPPHRGISLFVAEKGPSGCTVSRDIDKIGYKGVDTSEVLFEDFPVPAANLIGGTEGAGFKQVMSGLEVGRINIAARAVGVARAAFEDAIRYAQQRETFGKPICEHQAIQLKLADMATKLEAARLLTHQAARKKDRGERCDMEAGMAKLFASETAQEVSLEAMRILGGYGYTKEFRVERYYRDAPLMIIGEGTNEIQRIVIAKNLIRKYSI